VQAPAIAAVPQQQAQPQQQARELQQQQPQQEQQEPESPPPNNRPNEENRTPTSLLRRILVLAGAVPMTPEEEAHALAQLVDMFPQYDRSDLMRELRQRGSPEAVAESILMGTFSGVPR